ncbi:MAG: hypothetical protein JRE40_09075 [Deltaproteobacteria bacterium]|nr:hypothetical protein [Deltaproteobacteria bacterium]
MSEPEIVSCPADAWTKIATGVLTATVYRKIKGQYLQTQRDTGNAAPDPVADLQEGVSAFSDGDRTVISASNEIDIYLMPLGFSGRIRREL